MQLMRIIFILFLFFLFAGIAFGDSVKRYQNSEIENLYQSSQFYFDQGNYQKAIKILKNIDPHQHTIVQTHIEALKIMVKWSSYYESQLSSLEKLGVNKQALYNISCDYALNEHQYSMYSTCAQNSSTFVDKVDKQIISMLENYYNQRDKAFHSFARLAALVNKDELSMAYDNDVDLLKERIRAVLASKNCETKMFYCKMPIESIAPVIQGFIYGNR